MLLLLKHVELLLQCVPGRVPQLLLSPTMVVVGVLVAAAVAGELLWHLVAVLHLRQEAPLPAAPDGAHRPEPGVDDPGSVLGVEPQGAHHN